MRRSSIVAGVILILVGLFFLVVPYFPNISNLLDIAAHWPLIIVSVGVLFLVAAFLGTPGLAIPGSLIGGFGGLLYYQNLTGDWASWAYAWTLFPGFVGVGIVIARIIDRRSRKRMQGGGTLILISLIMFLVFGSFLGGAANLSLLWAILLIGLGLRLLLSTLGSNSRKK
jgi:hypothetical protein